MRSLNREAIISIVIDYDPRPVVLRPVDSIEESLDEIVLGTECAGVFADRFLRDVSLKLSALYIYLRHYIGCRRVGLKARLGPVT